MSILINFIGPNFSYPHTQNTGEENFLNGVFKNLPKVFFLNSLHQVFSLVCEADHFKTQKFTSHFFDKNLCLIGRETEKWRE